MESDYSSDSDVLLKSWNQYFELFEGIWWIFIFGEYIEGRLLLK